MADLERRIRKTAGTSELIFNPQGSRIELLVLKGHEISSIVTRGDGSQASGHPCAPNFDEDTAGFGFKRHGVARDSLATVTELTLSSISTEVQIKKRGYPSLLFRQYYSLFPDHLDIDTYTENIGRAAAPVNTGNHPYFNSPEGWEGTTLNGQDVSEVIRNDGIVMWQTRNDLVIPGGPKIILEQSGLPVANLWTGRNERGELDRHYFTVSSVEGNFREGFFGSDASLIPPRNSRHTRLTIALG